MPDDFDPQDDDLALPQIPDPETDDDAQTVLRQMEDPESVKAPSEPLTEPESPLTFGESVESLKAADASPLEKPPEISLPTIDRPDTGAPPADFGADISKLVSADKPGAFTASPAIKAATRDAGDRDHDAAVPTNYEEFQQAVAGLKRTDGRPWDSRAVANLYRRYREATQDNGLEPPAGMEALDLFQREGEAGFAKAEKNMVHAQGDLFRLLTASSIEHSRTLTQLRNLLIRNRH